MTTTRRALLAASAWAFAWSMGRVARATGFDVAPDAPGDVIGALDFHLTSKGETLLDLARARKLGILELMAANPAVDPWVPKPGTPLVVPTQHVLPDAPREGIVINLAELRLYVFDAEGARTFPIGVGRTGYTTPIGRTAVVRKQENPTWYPTETTRADDPTLPAVVPPGPDNPLGAYALYLGWPTYAVHGTNKPWGVGRLISRGCIRLYPEDIAALYPTVKLGTPVTTVGQAVKLGWQDGALYLEVHPTRAQLNELGRSGRYTSSPAPDITERVAAAAGAAVARVDWALVGAAAVERLGYPIRIA